MLQETVRVEQRTGLELVPYANEPLIFLGYKVLYSVEYKININPKNLFFGRGSRSISV